MRMSRIVSVVVPSLALLSGCAAQQKEIAAERPAATEDELQQARQAREVGSAFGEYAFYAEPPRAVPPQKTSEPQTSETPKVVDTPAPVVVVTPASAPDCSSGVCQGDLLAVVRQTVLNFDFAGATLAPLNQGRLQVLADVLKKYPTARIEIAGNCDERGTDEYNLHLGQQRAEAAKSYLVSLGIDPARIDAISYGFHRPVDERHNEEAWSMNRRDDFSVKAAGVAAVSTGQD